MTRITRRRPTSARSVVDAVSYWSEKKLYRTCALLDVSQAFDRVWREGLLAKSKKFLRSFYFLIVKSYLSDRHFQTRVGGRFLRYNQVLRWCSSRWYTLAGSLPYLCFWSSDYSYNALVADYANDKAIISIHKWSRNSVIWSTKWYTKWRFNINQSKSIHTTSILRLAPCTDVFIYVTHVPVSSSVKYLGIILDQTLTWARRIGSKRLRLNSRLRSLKTLISNNKFTQIYTKLLI